MNTSVSSCTAFNGTNLIAAGSVREVALKAKAVMDRDKHAQILIFDDLTSELVEVDFRGTAAQVANRLGNIASNSEGGEAPSHTAEARRPGRPKLGVVAREVTL